MGIIRYLTPSSIEMDVFLSEIAREEELVAKDLRVLIALALQKTRETPLATAGDIASATSMPVADVEACLRDLASRGYVRATASDAEVGQDAPAGRKNVRKVSPRLEARIMDCSFDIDELRRQGDARSSGSFAPSPAFWDPLANEETQPAKRRFLVWLRVALSPDEFAACRTAAIDFPQEWDGLISRFDAAKATGRMQVLLNDVRRLLAAPPLRKARGSRHRR